MSAIYGYRLVGDEWKSLHLHQSFTMIEFFSCALPHPKTNANSKCSSNVANFFLKMVCDYYLWSKDTMFTNMFQEPKRIPHEKQMPKMEFVLVAYFWSMAQKLFGTPISYVYFFHVIHFNVWAKSSMRIKSLKNLSSHSKHICFLKLQKQWRIWFLTNLQITLK